jgi:hypothetical protein
MGECLLLIQVLQRQWQGVKERGKFFAKRFSLIVFHLNLNKGFRLAILEYLIKRSGIDEREISIYWIAFVSNNIWGIWQGIAYFLHENIWEVTPVYYRNIMGLQAR